MADICWSGCLCIEQDGQQMLRKVRGCVGGARCHCVRAQVFSDAFAKAMHSCAWTVMEAGYCLLVHARL